MNKYEHLLEKLSFNDRYTYFNVKKLDKNKYAKLPFCMRILLESLVRNYDNNNNISEIDINNCLNWCDTHKSGKNVYIPYLPARVILQDFSGVPAIIDFASMRNINPDNQNIHSLCPADVVLDHAIVDVPKKICIQKSVQSGCPLANNSNPIFIETGYIECPFHNIQTECADEIKAIRELKFERDKERLMLLKWCSKTVKNVVLIPPFNGISHKTNIECLARIVFNKSNLLYPDSVFGTDSHTTMTNGLGLLSLDMGAIECENVMLGQSVQIKLPNVIGYKIVGKPNDYVSSIDIILAITKHLRQLALNNHFVEFFGCGCKQLMIVERETISHMCAEYDALVGYFSIDAQTMDYFRRTGRTSSNCDIIEHYLKAVKLFRDYANEEETNEIFYTKIYEFDLSNVVTYCSGPRRTQDKCILEDLYLKFKVSLTESVAFMGFGLNSCDVEKTVEYVCNNECYKIGNGSVLIASIDSYTNSSNPTMLLAAGLLAKKAYELGLKVKPYIKTSLSPGSGLLTKHYLIKSGLIKYLELIGFNIVGYGCKNCIENSVELDDDLVKLVERNELVTVSVLSGNRNSENRNNKSVTKANYLVPPTLVILYSIVGHINISFDNDGPILINEKTNENINLSDLLPTRDDIRQLEMQVIIPEIYNKIDKHIFMGNEQWNSLNVPDSYLYSWNFSSTYIKRAPFFDNFTIVPKPIETIRNAHVLLYLGDTITTDHISPAGCISRTSPAGRYLMQQKVAPRDFNSFGSRRGNHEVMARSAFYNQRLDNKLVKANSLAKTLFIPKSMEMDIFDAAEMYKHDNVPVIILAGKEYGSGASRDWSVKGQWMLGVKAVIAESFNDTHRNNMLSMGILPLKFLNGENSLILGLTGKERFTINLNDNLTVKQTVDVQIDDKQTIKLEACIYKKIELDYLKHGGLLNYSYRRFIN